MKVFFFLVLIIFISILTYSQEVNISLKGYQKNNYKISTEPISSNKIKIKVLNKDNQPIENLNKNDFDLKIGSNLTEIVKVVPLSEETSSKYKVVLCLDNSASMNNYSKELLKILDTLISSLSKSAEISVLFFGHDNDKSNFYFQGKPLNIQLNKFAGNNSEVINFCKKYYKYDNLTDRTYLRDQIYVAFNSDKNLAPKDVFYILLSDGEDNASETSTEDVLSSYKSGKIYSVDFNRSENITSRRNILEELAEKSNGEYFKAKDAVELANYFNRIANKIIFSGYEVTYNEFLPPEITESGIFCLADNVYKNIDHVMIEEIKSKEFYPLLNYVFFEKNSAVILNKYSLITKENTAKFEENNLDANQLSVYYNILNIIGKRLQKYDRIKIKLIGCNDNEGSEKNNLKLSRDRAEVIKEYLVNVWNISPDRITIKAQNLPSKPSNIYNVKGQEENRRVEIVSDDPNLFNSVDILSNSKLSDPGNLQIHLDLKFTSPPTSWELFVKQNNQLMFSSAGKSYPPPYIPWNINESIKNKSVNNSPFEFVIHLKDSKGLETQKKFFEMPVKYLSSEQKKLDKISDKYVEKLSLVLFDFNSSYLNKRNQDILFKVKDDISNNSSIKMIGYTDSIGTEISNMKLSQSRAANALKEFVRLLKPVTKDLSSEGYGESVPLYDNETPEGRFYNRTCQLIIETPIGTKEGTNK